MRFAFAAGSQMRVERIGAEAQPVIIIDNALEQADRVVEDAGTRPYGRMGAYYPGLRAALSAEFTVSLFSSLRPLLTDVFSIDSDEWSGSCFYSIVTTPHAELAPIQRLPHYDSVEPNRIAALCYLCDPKFGGTSFYRHRATGFETVTADRFSDYKTALERDIRDHGMPPARYIEDGAPHFERIKTFGAAFNRMLIYRGVNLHCSAINNAIDLPASPSTGRLTLNAFLQPA